MDQTAKVREMSNVQKQCLLAYLGFLPAGGVDGIWGQQSRRAAEDFQRKAGLKPDGIIGPETEAALRHAVAGGMAEWETAGTFWEEIEFFVREEFRCKCGGRYCDGFPAEPREDLVRLADGARRHFGRPADVVSGLRCFRHNANEGGVENSQHIYGEAVDLKIRGLSSGELLRYFLAQPGVRYAYAINGTNVHVDVPKGKR